MNGAVVSAADRGLQYGDGVFETLTVRDGRALRLERHLARLADGCRRLGFDAPPVADELRATCAGVERAVLKLIVTRGAGGRGYAVPAAAVPTHVLTLHAWPEHDPRWARGGVAVRWCDLRLAAQPALAGLKHLNRLEQVLARAEWRGTDEWQEGLLCDAAGHVIEATAANLFVVRDGALRTPRVDECGVAGVVRALLLEAAASLGIAADEALLSRTDVDQADEVFLCNSVIGIWPVARIGSVTRPAPGPVTNTLQRWLEAAA